MGSLKRSLYALIGGLMDIFLGAWFCAIYVRPYNIDVSGVFIMLVLSLS